MVDTAIEEVRCCLCHKSLGVCTKEHNSRILCIDCWKADLK